MTLKEIYRKLKDGSTFTHNNQYICVDTCDRYNATDYGKSYIYWQHAGSSANSVSYADFLFVVHTIFGIKTAKEFMSYFTEE